MGRHPHAVFNDIFLNEEKITFNIDFGNTADISNAVSILNLKTIHNYTHVYV